VDSLSGLFDWAFEELKKGREQSKNEGETVKSAIAERTCRDRLDFALDMMDKSSNMVFEQGEVQHLYCLEIVDHLYNAYPDYVGLLDEMTKDRGYIKRLLLKPKPIPEQPWQHHFKACLEDMKKAVMSA
jgi:hypothetical protein